MREYKLAVCDDQQCFIDEIKVFLKAYLSESKNKVIVSEYHSGEELLEDIEKNGLDKDILFLDVEMPGKTGIAVAEDIRKNYPDTVICFITSHEDFARIAFDVEALGYLMKPVEYQKLRDLMKRCTTQVQYQRNAREAERQYIEIKVRRGTAILDVEEILYVEKRKNQCVFHMEDGEVLSYMTLKQARQLLDDTVFCTVHQGYIVNFHHIKEVKSNSVCLGKNREVPVSRRNQEILRKLHMKKIESIRLNGNLAPECLHEM